MAELVAKTYAQAIFEVAIESNQLDRFGEELTFVSEIFQKNEDFYQFYITHQISKEEKKQVIQDIFKENISSEIMNFLNILLDKRRASSFKGIVEEYQHLSNVHKNIVEGVVITAIPLKSEDQATIEKKLSGTTGQTIKLKNEVDPSIVGGILVRIGDKVIDGTIKGRLIEFQKDLAQIIV